MEHDFTSPAGGEPHVRTIEETDPATLVMDLGERADHITTDVVGDTLIVVNEETDNQFEYPLPGTHRRTFMQNGVLTIEVEE